MKDSISAKISPGLKTEIDALAKAEGLTLSKLTEDLLTLGLDAFHKRALLEETLETRLARLEKKFLVTAG